jgi:type IV pilus assembly protein PilO
MPDLRQTRTKIKTALAVMAVVDVLALIAYLSPLVGSADSRRQEMNRLQAELTTKTRQVEPLRNLPQKVKIANGQIVDFYKKRFPSQDSQIAIEFGKLAAADGVTIQQAKYKLNDKDKDEKKEAVPDKLQAMTIEADLAGSYVSLAKFINALERDDMFFIINNVTLGGEQQGPVKLNVKVGTYLKAGV